jgi:hypothetical protein
MRKRGLPAARELPIVPLRQGGQPAVRAAGMRSPHEARPPRLVRRLSRTRHPHGYDAERRGGDGRRASPHRRERDVPPAANIRALAAVEIMKLEHLIILQNKVDLIKEAQALEHQKSISAFVKGACLPSPPHIFGMTEWGGRRHGGRVVAYRADLRTAQIQHRRRKRIHRQAHPNPSPRLHLRPAPNRDPFLRREQARRGSRRAKRRRSGRFDPNRVYCGSAWKSRFGRG